MTRDEHGPPGSVDPALTALSLVLAAVRSRRPLVHQVGGPSTAGDAAHAVLAFGGAPVLAIAREEVAQMASQADALVLNLGMLTRERLDAMVVAGAAANRAGVPVILDPVGAGATEFRSAAVRQLLSSIRVAVVRGNASEIGHLAGHGARPRGVDAVVGTPVAGPRGADPVTAPDRVPAHADAEAADPVVAPAVAAACALSRRTGAVVAATGPRDVVTDGTRCVLVDNGSPWLARISGSGCMSSALVGCCAGVEADRMLAAVAALASLGIAGERAAQWSNGPGSFRAVLLDCLAGIAPDDILSSARLVTARCGATTPPGVQA